MSILHQKEIDNGYLKEEIQKNDREIRNLEDMVKSLNR